MTYSDTAMTASKPFRNVLHAILFVAAFAVSTASLAQSLDNSVVTTDQVRAELMAHAPDGIAAGRTVWVGLQLTHQKEWHTYWKNSGDSGLPTTLDWTLPAGVTAGAIDWPIPKLIRIGNLANYGYEDTILLPVALTVGPDFQSLPGNSQVRIGLKARWLVCRTECIPQEGEFSLSLPVRGSTAINSSAFDTALAARPRPVMGNAAGVLPQSSVQIEGSSIKLTVHGLPVALRGKTLDFFPETPEVIATAAPWTQGWSGDVWSAQVPLSPERSSAPSILPVVLGAGGQGYRAELKVLGAWPKVGVNAAGVPALASAPASGAVPSITLLAALLGALLGGLILNLMPCVFPVLSIKVMSLTSHSEDRHALRIDGLAYSAGVLISFLALGALMLVLRSSGEQLGWGFQLQSPAVIATLALLFTVMGLNLAGLFEFGMLLPSGLASLQVKNPAVNAFLSGVLAVAIASPCTAPFMGAALGLALGLPTAQALLIFASLGLGMALPYLLVSLVPGAARMLPRPGAWMQTFRRAMAFPMFATVVWLVWVLGQQSGIDGAGSLLALLVALSMVLWSFTLRGRSRVVVASISIALCALLTVALGQNILRNTQAGSAVAATERWQPWAPGRVEQALAKGGPVFVDFTAAWCVTCQYNKKTTLSDPAVVADFDARKVTLLRADWTRRDSAITAALAQLGRNGVPVYALYKGTKPPVLLPELLTPAIVHAALATL